MRVPAPENLPSLSLTPALNYAVSGSKVRGWPRETTDCVSVTYRNCETRHQSSGRGLANRRRMPAGGRIGELNRWSPEHPKWAMWRADVWTQPAKYTPPGVKLLGDRGSLRGSTAENQVSCRRSHIPNYQVKHQTRVPLEKRSCLYPVGSQKKLWGSGVEGVSVVPGHRVQRMFKEDWRPFLPSMYLRPWRHAAIHPLIRHPPVFLLPHSVKSLSTSSQA